MATPTKYDLLEHIVLNSNEHNLDQAGNYNVVAGIVKTISRSYGSEEELADVLYEFIASCYVTASEDEEDDITPPAPIALHRTPETTQ